MSNEINFSATIAINKRTSDGSRIQLQYVNTPNSFTDDMDGAKGPTPGAIAVDTFGTDIDLSELTRPGWCVFKNLDENNACKIGVWNPDQSEFYPILRLKAGAFCIVPLDPEINQEYTSTGTGLTGQLNTLRALFENADGVLSVEAFEE